MISTVSVPAPAATPRVAPVWRALLWVPSLYLAEGIPYNVIMGGTAARMYKSLGYTDGQITVPLGYIGIAWSLKPLWAAFLDMYRTKKFFVLAMEMLLAVIFTAVAFSLPFGGFFQVSIALFAVAALASSTQDICADGVYLTSLSKPVQARLAGVQSTFWVLGKVLATGALIWSVDRLKKAQGWSEPHMWSVVLLASAAVMVALAAWHFVMLPTGSIAQRPDSARGIAREFLHTAETFFHKRMFWGMIAFVFLYRLGEGLIMMEGPLFLQSSVQQGGLGLSAGEVSGIDAVWGTSFNIIGGLLGGLFVSRLGLGRSLAVLGICLNVPHFTYVYLSHAAVGGHGVDYSTVVTMVSIEKFGYGFGFVGNMIYMMQQLAPGRWTMTHYAFATALMNLVLIPTNMISGPLAEWLGFSTFFAVVMVASVPSIWAAWQAPFPLAAAEASGDETTGEKPTVTVDDPTRLTSAERTVQVSAGRASIYAMLHILTILLLDAKILGWLRERPSPTWQVVLLLLLGACAGLKIFFARRTFAAVREAEAEAARSNESVYVRNARGAKIATLVCGVVGVVVLAVGAKLAL